MKIVWEETDLQAGRRVVMKTTPECPNVIYRSGIRWILISLTSGYAVYPLPGDEMVKYLNDHDFIPAEMFLVDNASAKE